jgi:capsular polysaccharide biosynthesis protein
MQTNMERGQQGEQMRLLNPASLPESPSFPNRLLFAGGGAGAGLAIGGVIALGLELKDKSIRTEQDVLAALELPVLVSLPWVGGEVNNGNKYGRRSKHGTKADEKKEMVEV